VPPLLSFLLMIAAGWVHRHQLIVIDFLQTENRLLKAHLRGRRIRFTDAERALIARKAKAVGRKALLELDTIVSPDTLLRWHRRLVAQQWTFVDRRSPGRPGIMRHISELIVRMASENPTWGYTRIQGALANLRHKVGRGTIANVLKRNGIEPSPERSRRTPWSTFLKAHWKVLAASDFLTVEVWTGRGLVTYYLLFVISLAETQVGGRAAVEDAIVAQFKAIGVDALASHAALASDETHPEPDLVQAIRASGANGVLLTQVKQVIASEPYMNSFQTITSPNPDIGGYFDLFQSQQANQPNDYKTARVDTRVYVVPGGKQVWGAYSDSYDAVSFSRSMPGFTSALMAALEHDGMIRRRPDAAAK